MDSASTYSSFDVSKRLYELSGWPGDVDWADWLPISEENYPAYTCGYLIRQLAGVVTGFGVSIRIGAPIRYEITYMDVPPPPMRERTYRNLWNWHERSAPFAIKSASTQEAHFFQAHGRSAEDALTQFCIELWRHDKFLAYKPGRR